MYVMEKKIMIYILLKRQKLDLMMNWSADIISNLLIGGRSQV